MADAVLHGPAARSPLHELEDTLRRASQDAGDRIQLREVPFLAQVSLRGDADNPAFRQAVRDVVGFDIPLAANTSASAASVSGLWLGPDEWLVVGAPGTEDDLVGRLRENLQGIRCAVVNVSDVRAVIELSGTRSRELLSKGCGLDLRPRSFRPGDCAQTLIAHANVLLHLTDAAPIWRLYVRNSLANYLVAWLLDATAEFRAAKLPGDFDSHRPGLFGASQ